MYIVQVFTALKTAWQFLMLLNAVITIATMMHLYVMTLYWLFILFRSDQATFTVLTWGAMAITQRDHDPDIVDDDSDDNLKIPNLLSLPDEVLMLFLPGICRVKLRCVTEITKHQ